ncbi:hypothetical protein RHGRI_024778 [Rhododendron griersonianum]|uniref:F-box domain-containing protein n=1 Tax=Rhododendron griersonianum TaxID=479676 RepID=A0AAV6JB54_9ERIC|nr:hypothetical protein RHGRI_024778 [Rhododendron griersonianum]
MKERCKELPEELWESILNRLALDHDDYRDLRFPSLVCRQFLSITNKIRRKFVANADVFYIYGCEALCRALERFKNLKEMELSLYRAKSDVNYPVLKIAYSGLDLQSLCFGRFPICPSADTFRRLSSTMNNLKILRCSEFDSLRDIDLVPIADAFPRLEELDIQRNRNMFGPQKVLYPKLSDQFVTDAGIEAMSRNLRGRGLRSIDISGNYFCSDLSLVALSSNCVLLNEIKCRRCDITRRGIDWVLSHSPNLTSLQAEFYGSSRNSAFPFDDTEISATGGSKKKKKMITATGLRELDIEGSDDKEGLLRSIAKAGIPLEKLSLCGQLLYQSHRLTTLLRAFPILKHLKVRNGYWVNDGNIMIDICRCLPNIEYIELDGCYSLTATTFSVLAKECPALSEITLINGYMRDDFVVNLERNYRVVYLDLTYTRGLKDKLLKDIVVACPNLQTLKVWGCRQLTKEGLEEILKCCPQIKHLTSAKYGEILSKAFNTLPNQN